MKIKEIKLANVTTHGDTTLSLPDTGLVLVTGANGSGKSSLIEGVPLAVWGKSLRGSRVKLWSAAKAEASVTLDDTGVVTRRNHGRLKLEWGTDEHRTAWESTSHAQSALTERVGTLDDWRRAHVLSSQDGATFARATDTERKAILEKITAASYDAAYAQAREELREQRRRMDKAIGEVQHRKDAVLTAESHLRDWERFRVQDPPEPPGYPPPPVPDHIRKRAVTVAECREQVTETQWALHDASTTYNQTKRELALVKAQLASLERQGACPTCGSTEHTDAAGDTLRRKKDELKTIRVPITAQAVLDCREKQDADGVALRAAEAAAEVVARYEEECRAHERAVAQWEKDSERQQQCADAAKRAAAALEEKKSELAAAEADLAETRRRLVVDTWVATALSPQGIRAHLLAGVLRVLEVRAQHWLDRLFAGRSVEVKIRPYGAKANGERKDAVTLEINLDGGTRTWEQSSGGERRRVDVALALALADVSRAHGDAAGTLFCDEVFDALDEEGVAAAVEVLREIAKDRCVVVVSHTETKATLLKQAAVRYIVEDGTLTRC